jgi:hypothetical protein
MKSVFFISALFLLIFSACDKKIVATKEPVIPKRDMTWSPRPIDTVLKVSLENAGDPSFIAGGKAIFQTRCTRCHEQKNPADFTELRWAGILQQMAPRARLSDYEKEEVAAYVKTSAKK